MDRRFHKRAISAAAAVMTLTTVVTSVDAAAKNEITIKSDKVEAQAGDRLSVDVGITPDSTGVAGFTFDLHYDPEAVSLVIPEESDYQPDSKFTLVTNFEYEDGAVRIVGVNPTGGNVTAEIVAAELEFTVNDGYSGDAGFWTEVEDLVAVNDGEFYNVEFTAFGEYSPYVVKVAEADSETDDSLPEPDESSEIDSSAADSSSEEDSLPEPDDSSQISESLPDEVIPPADVIIPEVPDDSSVPDDSEASGDPSDTDSTDNPDDSQGESDPDPLPVLPDEGENENGNESESGVQTDPNALFSYKQGGEDYNNESALQYTFSPFDFAETDDVQTVDISVTVDCDGGAAGGIGMQTVDGWEIYSAETDGSGAAVWTAEDVDLTQVSGDMAVQLYYLQHDSEFKITSISVTSSGAQVEVPDAVPDVPSEPADDNFIPNVTPTEPTEDNNAVVEEPDDIVPPQENADTDADSDTDSSSVDIPTAVPEQGEESADSAADGSVSEDSSVNNPQGDNTQTPASADSSSEQDGNSAAAGGANSAPPKSDANPDTGSFAKGILPVGIIGLCIAQIIYSSVQLLKKER